MAEYDDNFEMDEDDDVPNEHDALRREVGDCIHSWCELERALVSVLSWVLNTPDHKADIIFAGVVSFAAKLDFIDELMQEELEDRPELAFWVSMAGNLRTLSKGAERSCAPRADHSVGQPAGRPGENEDGDLAVSRRPATESKNEAGLYFG